MKTQHSFISIDESALVHNYTLIRKLAPTSKILAMVKANAYGHGLIKIAKALGEVDGFGVACLSEAALLRKENIIQKIVLMRGVYNQEELDLANQLKLDLVVHTPEQLSLLSHQTHWLKINTGMNRLGFLPEEFAGAYQKIKNNKLILMTHFSSSEENKEITENQIKLFNTLTKNLSHEKSLANSGGILNYPTAHADWIRPGLILYGVLPSENKLNLKPVMTWKAQLIAIHHQKKDDAIGYNKTYICEENMPVGIVGVGYADGYPRHAKNGTPILINGVECPLVGRVSMDMLAIDLRLSPSAKIGNWVTLWGDGLPIEKVAKHTATNSYELLCNARTRS